MTTRAASSEESGATMHRDEQYYSVQMTGSRVYQPGDVLEAGTPLGVAYCDGQMVRAERTSRVVEVQYDIWQERLILVLEPASR